MNIFQNGFALNNASILSTALENKRNFANMSVMLMQVMPKGSTDASSVIISSRVRMLLSLLLVGEVAVSTSGLGFGTNRECTAGQLSTMCTNIARLNTFQ